MQQLHPQEELTEGSLISMTKVQSALFYFLDYNHLPTTWSCACRYPTIRYQLHVIWQKELLLHPTTNVTVCYHLSVCMSHVLCELPYILTLPAEQKKVWNLAWMSSERISWKSSNLKVKCYLGQGQHNINIILECGLTSSSSCFICISPCCLSSLYMKSQ